MSEIIRTCALTAAQQAKAASLVRECQIRDCIRLSFPQDGDVYYLMSDGDGLLQSFLALFHMEESLWECCAFTRPDCRQSGCFTRLLQEALKDLSKSQGREEISPQLLFLADPVCKDTRAVLDAIGASFWYNELIMERDLKSSLPKDSSGLTFDWRLSHDRETVLLSCRLGHTPLGSCRIHQNCSHGFLHDFEIQQPFRGQGWGNKFMAQTLAFARAELGLSSLRLQVSDCNAPAMALYKKTGFLVTETLAFYLY